MKTIQQKASVRQPGKRIIKGQIAYLFLGPLARSDVAEYGNILGNRALLIFHRSDVQPFRINLAIFAPIAYLAGPCALLQQQPPHLRIKLTALPPRAEDAGILAQHLLRAESGDLLKCPIDTQDIAPHIGDHDALMRLKRRCCDALCFFGLLALGNIEKCDDCALFAILHGWA